MKGISAVLATVLIVVITVAIIGMYFGFARGLFGTVTTAGNQEVGGVTASIEKRVEITAATCNTNGITFTVKATGTADVAKTDFNVFVNETMLTASTTGLNALVAGASEQATTTPVTGTFAKGTYTLKVDAPAGAVTQTVTCP